MTAAPPRAILEPRGPRGAGTQPETDAGARRGDAMAVVQPAARPPDPEVRIEAVAAAARVAPRRGTAAAAAVLHLLEALGRGPGPAAAEHLFRQLVRLGAGAGGGRGG